MIERPNHGRRSAIVLFWLAAATLFGALVLGGGPGWRAEQLLIPPALLTIVMAVIRLVREPSLEPSQARLVWLLPLLLLSIPILQLIPLPGPVWTHLPGRVSLAVDLQGVLGDPGWRPLSLTPFQTEAALELLCVPCAVYMAGMALPSDLRRRLLDMVLAVAAISALLGLLQVIQGPDSSLYFHAVTNRGYAVGLFANRSHLASFLASLLPVAIGMLMDRARHVARTERDLRVWCLTALVILLAVAATATRARIGFVMLTLSAVAAILVAWRTRRRGGSGRRAQIWLRIGALLALVLIVQYTLFAFLPRLEGGDPVDPRWRLARETVLLATPVRGVGYGIGSYPRVHDLVGASVADTRVYVNHAHDDYLELWLEAGVPAVLLAAAAVAALVWQLLRQWRNLGRPPRPHDPSHDTHRALRFGATFGLLLLALHSAVDYPLRTLALESYAGLLVALVVRPRRRRT